MIFVRLKKQGTPQRRPEFGRLNGTRAFFLRECFDDVLFAFVLLVLWTRINAQRRPLGSNFFEFSPPFPPSETFFLNLFFVFLALLRTPLLLTDFLFLSLSLFIFKRGTHRPINSTKTQIQTGNLSYSRNQKVSKINRLVDSKTAFCEAGSRDLQRVYGSTDAMDRGGVVSVARVLGGLFSAFVRGL